MSRILSSKEEIIYIQNREFLHEQLSEIQADLEDMTDEELIANRACILSRVNQCLVAVLETEKDNI